MREREREGRGLQPEQAKRQGVKAFITINIKMGLSNRRTSGFYYILPSTSDDLGRLTGVEQ